MYTPPSALDLRHKKSHSDKGMVCLLIDIDLSAV